MLSEHLEVTVKDIVDLHKLVMREASLNQVLRTGVIGDNLGAL